MKKRHKKNKNKDYTQESTENSIKSERKLLIGDKGQIEMMNKYLNIDLNEKSAATWNKYKYYIDNLNSLLPLLSSKTPESRQNFLSIFSTVNKRKEELEIKKEKEEHNSTPTVENFETMKLIYEAKFKKVQDKQKFRNLLIEKFKKLGEERKEMIESIDKERQEMIDKTQEFMRKKQEELNSSEERKKLIDENTKYKEEIRKQIEDASSLKDDFDKTMEKTKAELESMQNDKLGSLQKSMELLQNQITGGLFKNTQLKTTLEQLKLKNKQTAEIKQKADEQYNTAQEEIKKKNRESLLLAQENQELRERIKNLDKKQVQELLMENQTLLNKIEAMNSLNKKYIKEYNDLTGEKIKRKKAKKKRIKKKNKDKNKDNNENNGENDINEDNKDSGKVLENSGSAINEITLHNNQKCEDSKEESLPLNTINQIEPINRINEITTDSCSCCHNHEELTINAIKEKKK